MGIEIEKKYLVEKVPSKLKEYPCHIIEQAYLNVDPAIRVRREDETYYMTYKGAQAGSGNDIGKTEYNMPLDAGSYEHLLLKADGNVIRKTRYLIPLNGNAFDDEYLSDNKDIKKMMDSGELKIELDVFEAPFEGRMLAEVEFPSEDAARNYHPADWLGKDVTGDVKYSNSRMSTEEL